MALPKRSGIDWTVPEDLLKEMVDLQTAIVVIIEPTGKVLPPIPKELNEETLEVGIRFFSE